MRKKQSSLSPWPQTFVYGADDVLSQADASASVLNQSDVLAKLGILGPIAQVNGGPIAPTYPDFKGTARPILNLIGNGAMFEGDPATMVRNHFFNPLNNQPLTYGTALGCASPDWALEDRGQIDNASCGKQEFSYADARKYFYYALTQYQKSDRDKNFGLTFESMGHIVHHLQDMAQPQHVRNDQHVEAPIPYVVGLCGLSAPLCAYYFAIRSPSAYEIYTDKDEVLTSPTFKSYLSPVTPAYPGPSQNSTYPGPGPAISTPRGFWKSVQHHTYNKLTINMIIYYFWQIEVLA